MSIYNYVRHVFWPVTGPPQSLYTENGESDSEQLKDKRQV